MNSFKIQVRLTTCVVLVAGIAAFLPIAQCQTPQPAPPQDPAAIQTQPEGATIRVTSSMVLVDIITTDGKTGLPLNGAKKEDFHVMDDNHEVDVKSFDSGFNYSTRPIALWFVVQCYQKNWDDFGSGFMHERTKLLKPALAHLDKKDTVGVAHWCDDGTQGSDHLPDRNVDGALSTIEEMMKKPPVIPGTRLGELALLKCLRGVLDQSQQMNPQPLPVIVFLYGDHSGMERADIDAIQDELLKRSVIVFGINNGVVQRSQNFGGNSWSQPNVAMFLAWRTGGAFFGVKPENFSDALDAILMQVHFRYVLGFSPAKLDGKRHLLKVELSAVGKQKFKDSVLKSRPEYIPAN
jgi:hypothetical protein